MKMQLTLLFLLLSIYGSAQVMVVNDLSANQTLTTQLATSTEQLTQLQKNYQLLKDAESKYKKINSIVMSVANIDKIIKLQSEAISDINLIMRHTNYTGKNKAHLSEFLNRLLVNMSEKVETASNVISEGFFDMTDKERIDMFEKLRQDVFAHAAVTRGKALPYRNLN